MDVKTNSHLGKKALYTIVILMSSLLILLSAAGVLGIWLVERPLSDSAVTLLKVVEESAVAVRGGIERLDIGLVRLQGVTGAVSDASQQLSQNVTDKGLVMVLLPEEQEQNLIEAAVSVRDTFGSIRGTLTRALGLYRSIDRLPFIDLPALEEDQLESIAASVEKTQTFAQNLRQEIADFRSGVSTSVDRVTDTAAQLDSEVSQVRDRLSQLDARMAALEALALRLQQVTPTLLMALALILTVLFAFLIFTQAEVIRLYVQRWRQLNEPEETAAPENLPQPVP